MRFPITGLKRALVLTALLLGCSGAGAQAQTVTLQNPQQTLGQALKEIGAQTGLKLAVNQANLDQEKTIGLTLAHAQLNTAMERLLENTSHTYIVRNDYLMVFPINEITRYVTSGESPRVQTTEIPTHAETRAESRPIDKAPIVEVTRPDNVPVEIIPVQPDPVIVNQYNTQLPAILNIPKSGPKVALKTNLLYGGATLTPNLGIEIGLGKKTTLDISAGYNPWNLNGENNDNKKLVHYLIQPEFRWWLCERFNGHFFGVHGLFSHYNIAGHDIPLIDFEKQFRYEGYAYGGGVSYGYHWMLSKHWGLEFTIGVGAAYLKYDKYDCARCRDKIGTESKTYFGPTKAGINLVFIIK